MQAVPRDIQVRQIQHFLRADPAYGTAVARGLGIDLTPEEMRFVAA
jgi:catalase